MGVTVSRRGAEGKDNVKQYALDREYEGHEGYENHENHEACNVN